MAKTDKDKIQDTLAYLRQQLELFMYKNFRITFRGKLYANKSLKKERRYAKTTFLPDGSVEIDLEYDMLLGKVEDKDVKDKKGLQLRTVFREGCRIALQFNGMEDYNNGDPDFEGLCAQQGLKSYGKVAEMGDTFHSYVCANCHNVQMLKKKKLPPTRDPSAPGSNKRTPCCQERYFYEGQKYFTNLQLQKVQYLLELQQKKMQQAGE